MDTGCVKDTLPVFKRKKILIEYQTQKALKSWTYTTLKWEKLKQPSERYLFF